MQSTKRILALILILIVSIIVPGNIRLVSAADSPTVIYTYYVDPSKDTIHVKMEISWPQWDITLQQEGLGFRCQWKVTNVTIYGDGEKLTIAPQVSDDGCISYLLPTSKYNKIVVEYNVPTTVTRGSIDYVQYKGEDFILIRPDIFLPKNLPYDVTSVKTQVIHPQEWDVITPGGKKFYDAISEIIFGSHHFIIVAKTGTFFEYTKQTEKGTQIGIYIHKSIKNAYKIEKQTVKLFEYYENLFGTPSPYGVYTVVFLPEPPDMPIWVGEGQYGQGISIDPSLNFITRINHAMFHVWEGWGPGGMAGIGEANWQWEGINEYYVTKSSLTMGIIKSYKESSTFREFYGVYKMMVKNGDDIALSKAPEYFNTHIDWNLWPIGILAIYKKGALVAMLLDLEIQKATGGRKSLDDVERIKFQEFGYRKKLYTNKDLLRIVNNVTGQDFSWFFEKYVWGTAKLPVDKYFEDYDSDGIINIDENSWRATIVYGDGRVDSEYAEALKRQSVDNNLLTDKDEIPDNLFPLILVGGPLANNLTKFYLENYFNLNITNDYPGRGKGIIAVKNINGRNVVILAGSDRWGTKAAVEVFGKMEKYPENIVIVDWNNGEPNIIKEIPWNN
ncbi:S-layer protein [Thermococcus nautili]|uniref:Putative transglutaminase-like protease n=1 Tax=Thermococcus nautili TaxID=195522 RepID=W8P778_9EURY|nr:S-layer protein [Thermococcus nautili]AHL23410.1 putative transglutaminase-like protease [Thermococcus nautili]CAI1492656.1 Putative transglutaminase-like protease [Thermococcus nautili]